MTAWCIICLDMCLYVYCLNATTAQHSEGRGYLKEWNHSIKSNTANMHMSSFGVTLLLSVKLCCHLFLHLNDSWKRWLQMWFFLLSLSLSAGWKIVWGKSTTRLPGSLVRRSSMSSVCLALSLPMRSSVQSGTGMACKYQWTLVLNF